MTAVCMRELIQCPKCQLWLVSVSLAHKAATVVHNGNIMWPINCYDCSSLCNLWLPQHYDQYTHTPPEHQTSVNSSQCSDKYSCSFLSSFDIHITFSVAKATLESLMSLEGVVILNLGCGYIENGVVICVRYRNPSASQNQANLPLCLSIDLSDTY